MGKPLSRLCWMGVLALAWIAAGCAGTTSSESAGPAGGSSGAPALAMESGGAGVDPRDGGAGAEDDSPCTGKLESVANAFGFACPREFCAARLLASDCAALPGAVTKTTVEQCSDYVDDLSVRFQMSPTQHKVCYYGSEPYDADATLIGAEAWHDAAGFCGGTTNWIQGGYVRRACPEDIWAPTVTLCDLARSDQPAQVDNEPPRACFNKFSRSCEPCCAATAPDCSDKPTGYPGYDCTPVGSPDPDEQGMEQNPWCSCSCYEAEWTCLC